MQVFEIIVAWMALWLHRNAILAALFAHLISRLVMRWVSSDEGCRVLARGLEPGLLGSCHGVPSKGVRLSRLNLLVGSHLNRGITLCVRDYFLIGSVGLIFSCVTTIVALVLALELSRLVWLLSNLMWPGIGCHGMLGLVHLLVHDWHARNRVSRNWIRLLRIDLLLILEVFLAV